MEPPEIRKLVGRPKVKRIRKEDEVRKREGLWLKSSKGLQMTRGNCSAPDHNRRKCPLVNHDQLLITYNVYLII